MSLYRGTEIDTRFSWARSVDSWIWSIQPLEMQFRGGLSIFVDTPQTRRQGCLMHIETTTNRVDHWHDRILPHRTERAG
jgi:hypothetical protein